MERVLATFSPASDINSSVTTIITVCIVIMGLVIVCCCWDSFHKCFIKMKSCWSKKVRLEKHHLDDHTEIFFKDAEK